MFPKFLSKFGETEGFTRGERGPWQAKRLLEANGYVEFASKFAGSTFGHGIYRFHDAESGPFGHSLVSAAFPEFVSRLTPFGYDWLGRQFSVDTGRMHKGQPLVMLIDPGLGEIYEIPRTFRDFHEVELNLNSEAPLEESMFKRWASANFDKLPLGRDQCVGYGIPPFLGGDFTLENLEISDLDVYWTFCGQLRAGLRGLPPGAPVDGVSGDL